MAGDESTHLTSSTMGTAGLGFTHQDSGNWAQFQQQAHAKVGLLKKQATKAITTSIDQCMQAASDIARSKDAKETGKKLWTLLVKLSNSRFVAMLARVAIAFFFLNLVYEDYETWEQLRLLDRNTLRQYPQYASKAKFPMLKCYILLPSALWLIVGYRTLIPALILMAFITKDSFSLVWTQGNMWIRYGQRPNELVVKRLAICGCTCLVLSNAIAASTAFKQYAGLLYLDDKQKQRAPGLGRSLPLLVGRVFVSSLFLLVGYKQVERVIARDMALWDTNAGGGMFAFKDGHDNNWLLLEFILALPFAIGFKTEVVSRLLALILALEAGTCWQFWLPVWPSWHYITHVRSHFFTNLAVAGGLFLLQKTGAGKYTVDELLKKRE